MKKRTRNQIADAAVRRWCGFYKLTPYFWRKNPDNTKSIVIRCAESEKRRKRTKSQVQYGQPEDRADCMAMIVGTLYVKGFERSELRELLELAESTIHRFIKHYQMIPNESRRALIQLDGHQAPTFYQSVFPNSKADSIKRLDVNRKTEKRGSSQ